MKSHPLIVETVETRNRNQVVDLTAAVREHVRRLRVADGMVVVFCPHTTAALTVNENFDPDVKHDLLHKLEQLVPVHESYYQHDEGNSDAHVKAALVGNTVTLIVDRGDLVLGRWQGIYFCEFDGPRHRTLHVQVLG